MLELLMLGATVLGVAGGYFGARNFVRDRLRYVEAIERRWAPWAAGAGAVLVASPVAWVLPAVGGGAALLFGAAVGAGVASGRRKHRELPPGEGYERL